MMLPLCDVKLNTGFKIPQSNVVKNVRKATCDSVNFTGKNSSFDFSDFDIKKSVKIYPGEIRKMEQGQWVLLPDCGATFELADCERLDTKTKDFEKRLNSLKNNETFTVGRGDFEDENRKISRKHLQFLKYNEKIYVRDISLNGTKVNVDGVFKNYDFKYLQEKYATNPNFSELINEKYYFLRRCRYSDATTFVSGAEPVQNAINSEVEYGYKKISRDWVYRKFDRISYPNSKVLQRMSLNVVAHAHLIKELDDFFATGFYKDRFGQWKYINNPDTICAYYKTPSRAENWARRHDPITIYSFNKITDEFYSAIAEITRKYSRKSENNIPLQGVHSKDSWISLEDEPNSENVAPIVERAANIDRNLGQAVYEQCYKNRLTPLVSTGTLGACRIVIDEYEEYLRQDKKRFATISLNGLRKYFNK